MVSAVLLLIGVEWLIGCFLDRGDLQPPPRLNQCAQPLKAYPLMKVGEAPKLTYTQFSAYVDLALVV